MFYLEYFDVKLMRAKVKDEDGCWSVFDICVLLCDWSLQVFLRNVKSLATRAMIFQYFFILLCSGRMSQLYCNTFEWCLSDMTNFWIWKPVAGRVHILSLFSFGLCCFLCWRRWCVKEMPLVHVYEADNKLGHVLLGILPVVFAVAQKRSGIVWSVKSV